MNQDEFDQTHARWPDYLATFKPDTQQMFALLSVGAHDKVIGKLIQSGRIQLAAVYSECCLAANRPLSRATCEQASIALSRYAEHLEQLDLTHLARDYQHKAGVAQTLFSIVDDTVRSARQSSDYPSFPMHHSIASDASLLSSEPDFESIRFKRYLIHEIPIEGL